MTLARLCVRAGSLLGASQDEEAGQGVRARPNDSDRRDHRGDAQSVRRQLCGAQVSDDLLGRGDRDRVQD